MDDQTLNELNSTSKKLWEQHKQSQKDPIQITIQESPEIIDKIIIVLQVLAFMPDYSYQYKRERLDRLIVTSPNAMGMYKLGILTFQAITKLEKENGHS